MATPQHIARLLYGHLSGTITMGEMEELDAWVAASDDRKLLLEELNDNDELAKQLALMHPDQWTAIDANIANKIRAAIEEETAPTTIPVHRIHFLKRSWWKYAAAIIIIFGTGAYLWNYTQKEKPAVTQNNPVPLQNDVAPGGNKATLTLADGKQINLDEAQTGQLAKEENATITKTADGKIEYEQDVKLGEKILYNSVATPRGGLYQLKLPDGSQVWLNAESSITYPTAFTGKERKVSITGEAYLEVKHNANQPFKVETGSQLIEVLGTKFNINAYKEEPTINTTLLEGSVRLTARDSRLTNVHTLILKPGQQGQLKDQQLSLAAKPDVEQVMAWKNGRFQFESAGIETIMRQLARAYDVDVKYEGKVEEKFGGGISRNVNISQVLKMLELTGKVKFRIEGRTVYVRP